MSMGVHTPPAKHVELSFTSWALGKVTYILILFNHKNNGIRNFNNHKDCAIHILVPWGRLVKFIPILPKRWLKFKEINKVHVL